VLRARHNLTNEEAERKLVGWPREHGD